MVKNTSAFSLLKSDKVYVGVIFGVTALMSYLMAGMIDFESGSAAYEIWWLGCFTFLTFNVSYMLMASLYHLFLKYEPFPETDLKESLRLAVIYPVKNETEGLYERIRYTLQSSQEINFDLWILSDSNNQKAWSYEEETLEKLRREFGVSRIRYRLREKPVEKKQGNLMEWIHAWPEYQYFFVCDADTMLPAGTLGKLAAKAEHPANRDIAMFQSRLEIVHAKTYFAKFQAMSAGLSQNLYIRVNQSIFRRQVSFGHGILIRTEAFLKLRLPKGIWSHDIWDTVLLDQMGWRTVFCHDTVCYDEVPAHYLEMLSRNRRWARGTLQSWPLIFKPGVSLGSRFYVAYGIYMYIVQPVFLLWILMSFWAAATTGGALLEFQRYAFLGGTLIDVELTGMAIFSLAVVFGHKIVLCRTPKDVWEVVKEILMSTLLCLNNILYQTIDLILIPFQNSGWIPIKKDPFAKVTLKAAAEMLWPSTILGILGFYFGTKESPDWTLSALPFLISFAFIIPLAYVTSREVVKT